MKNPLKGRVVKEAVIPEEESLMAALAATDENLQQKEGTTSVSYTKYVKYLLVELKERNWFYRGT